MLTFLIRSATCQSHSYPFVLTRLDGPCSTPNPLTSPLLFRIYKTIGPQNGNQWEFHLINNICLITETQDDRFRKHLFYLIFQWLKLRKTYRCSLFNRPEVSIHTSAHTYTHAHLDLRKSLSTTWEQQGRR